MYERRELRLLERDEPLLLESLLSEKLFSLRLDVALGVGTSTLQVDVKSMLLSLLEVDDFSLCCCWFLSCCNDFCWGELLSLPLSRREAVLLCGVLAMLSWVSGGDNVAVVSLPSISSETEVSESPEIALSGSAGDGVSDVSPRPNERMVLPMPVKNEPIPEVMLVRVELTAETTLLVAEPTASTTPVAKEPIAPATLPCERLETAPEIPETIELTVPIAPVTR